MGGLVTAHFIIGNNSRLDREKLDKIIEILNIRDADNRLVKPPIGRNCNYLLVLEKSRQHVPEKSAEEKSAEERSADEGS